MLYKNLLLMFIALLIITTLCSCAYESDTLNAVDSTYVTTTVGESSQTITSSEDCKIETKSIKAKGSTKVVQVLIPQLSSATDIDYLDVNKLIYDEVVQYLSRFQVNDLYLDDDSTIWSWDEDEYEATALIGEYSIKYCDAETISILFLGQVSNKSSAHPEHYSFTVNISRKDNRLIDVCSMYSIDMKLVGLIRKNSDWIVRKEQKEVLDTLSDSQLLDKLTSNEETYFYLSQNKLGIVICGLPYVVGNYCTIEVPIVEMNN